MPKGEAILFINLSPFLPIDKKYPPSFNHLILSYSTLVHSSTLPMTGVWIAEHIEQSADKQSRNLERILLPADEPDWKHWKVGAQAILDGWQGMVVSEQQPCPKKLQLVLLPRVLLQCLDPKPLLGRGREGVPGCQRKPRQYSQQGRECICIDASHRRPLLDRSKQHEF